MCVTEESHSDKNTHTNCNTDDHHKWNRRSFLQTLGLGGAGATLMMNGIPMAFGQPTPLTTALSNAESGRVLLIIRLQGGNDGLNTMTLEYRVTYKTPSSQFGKVVV